MKVAQSMMGLTASTKEVYTASNSVHHVGLQWTPGGVTIGDRAVKYLLQVMAVRPKGLKEAQRLRGVVLASSSAFHFETDERLVFSKLMAPLNQAIQQSLSKKQRFTWTLECSEAVDLLVKRF